MDEDRKAMAMQLGQPTTESLKDWTKSMLGFQNDTIQQQRAKFSTDHDNDIKNNFTASVSTTDHSVAKECNTATRIGLVAKGIRDWYNSNDIYDYDGWEDAPLVDAYKSTYPEYEDKIWEFVLDENQICDPSDLYQSLGFYGGSEGIDSTNPKSSFLQNVISGAGDGATGLGQFVGNTAADIIGWTAKKFGADDEKVDYLVDDFKNYLEESKISNSVGGNTDSLTYSLTKGATEIIESIGLGLAGEGALEAALGGPLIGPQSPWWLKIGVRGLEGAADMGIFDIIADQELPSGTDLSMGAFLGVVSPWLGSLIKGTYKLGKKGLETVMKTPGKIADKQFEKTLRKLVKLTEKREMDFYKDFGQTYVDFMKERNLQTYDDLVKYFADARYAKRQALGSIKGKFQSKELDDILNSSVDYARETSDKNLKWLEEYQRKNIEEGGLTMTEADEVREYFAYKKRFNFNDGTTTKEIDTNTNMYENFIEWERDIANANGFDNLADLNNDIKAGYILRKELRDLTKVGNKGASFYDFMVAASMGDIKKAMGYLFSKGLSDSPKLNQYYNDILKTMFKKLRGGRTVDTIVDFEKIQNAQSEKEILKWFKDNGIQYEQLPFKEGATNDAGKTILQEGKDTIVSTPSGASFREGDIVELPQTNTQK